MRGDTGPIARLAAVALLTSLAGVSPSASAQAIGGDEAARCRYEKPFRTPLHLLRWLPAGVLAVTVEGRFDLTPGRPLGRPDDYFLRDDDGLTGPVGIVPVRALAEDFRFEADFLRGRLLEVTACLQEPSRGGGEAPAMKFYAYAVIPERDTERPPREIELASLRDGAFEGQRVLVRGVLAGRRHRALRLSSRLSDSDWVLASGDAAAWMRGRAPAGEGFDLDPDDTADHGRGLAVVGLVAWWREAPFVHVESVRLARADAEVLRDAALFALPTGRELSALEQTIEVRFSAPVDPTSFEGRVALVAVPGERPLPVRWEYDAEWWSLLVEPEPPLASGDEVELRIRVGVVREDGEEVRPEPEAREGLLLARRYRVSRGPE